MYSFDRLDIGAEIGCREVTLDEGLVAKWRRLFPADDTGDVMPTGMVAVVTMRAYSEILDPRPPGNIHGAQRFEIFRLPRVGDRLATSLRCVGKQTKKDRLWIELATETGDAGGELLFRGRQTVIWAA